MTRVTRWRKETVLPLSGEPKNQRGRIAIRVFLLSGPYEGLYQDRFDIFRHIVLVAFVPATLLNNGHSSSDGNKTQPRLRFIKGGFVAACSREHFRAQNFLGLNAFPPVDRHHPAALPLYLSGRIHWITKFAILRLTLITLFSIMAAPLITGCSALYQEHVQERQAQASDVLWHSDKGTLRETIVAKIGEPSATETVEGELVDTYYVEIPDAGPTALDEIRTAGLIELGYSMGIPFRKLFHIHSDEYKVTYGSDQRVKEIECNGIVLRSPQ